MNYRKLGALALTSGLAAAALALAFPAAAQPQPGGTLTYAVKNDSGTLAAINNTSSTQTSTKVFEGLLSYDYDLNPQPLLATAWSVSPDGLLYSFALREGVAWSDGKPFTSTDVAFSIQRLKEAHPRGRSTFANIVEIRTPGPHKVEIVLSKPAPYLITALGGSESPMIPKHVFEGTDPAAPPTDAQMVGTGPFVLGERVRGSYAVFNRNPNYWDKPKPYVERLVVRFIPDGAARTAALEAGDADLVNQPGSLSDVNRLKDNPNLAVTVRNYAYIGPQHLLMLNLDNQHLKDLRVREAIAHAIDPKALVNVVYQGQAQVSPAAISVALPTYNDPSIKPRSFDIKRANQLLDEAGYKAGANGIRFPLRLMTNSDLDPRINEFLKQSLRRIGIDGVIVTSDFAVYIKTVYTDRAFDLAYESLSNTFDPTLGVQRGYWSKNFKIGLPFSNSSHYANPEADALLEAAAVEPDAAKRKDQFNRFQKVIDRDLPAINLVSPLGTLLAKKKLKDYAPGAEGIFNSFADAYFEK